MARTQRQTRYGMARGRSRRIAVVLAAVVGSAGLAAALATPEAGALPSNCTGTMTITCTYSYNGTDGTDGSAQTFDVPSNVTSVTIDAWGAQGGTDTTGFGTAGGLGGYASGTISVTPSTTLDVYVGGTPAQALTIPSGGGYNGGGSGWTGGGGASDVRTGSDLADRVVVAGGGGGAGSTDGGDAGGASGAAPPGCTGTSCPTGAGSSAGGSAGGSLGCTGEATLASDSPATAGGLGTGGAGEEMLCSIAGVPRYQSAGSGGGAGYYGGGGGGTGFATYLASEQQPAGGGGGSGYVSPLASDPENEAGVNSGNGQVTISYTPDTTAPTAAPTQSPPANSNGWNNTDVTVNWNWTDNSGGSGIDTSNCTTSSTSSGEGDNLSLSASCNDLAGNTGTATYSVNVDKTAPSLSPTVSPNPVLLGGTASANPNASDSLSGVSSSSCDPVDTSTPGPQSVSCTATDNAGNTANASGDYVVDFNVIHAAPQPGTMFLPGAKLPVKFQLAGANGLTVSNTTAESLPTCAATVTYPGRAPTCATYSATDHYFHATLPTPTAASLGMPVALAIQVTIDYTLVANGSLLVDPVPALQVTDTLIHPPTSGLARTAIPITLSRPSAETITFRWATAQGSATSPADYIGTAGNATIPAGRSSTTVFVQVRGNTHPDGNETFYVFVWDPQHTIVTRTIGTEVIVGHR